MNVLTTDSLFSILRRLNLDEAITYASEDLKRVAEESGANHILQASFSKAGDTFRIDYSLQEAETLKAVGSDHVEGIGEESFPGMIDELTKKIKTSCFFQFSQMRKIWRSLNKNVISRYSK